MLIPKNAESVRVFLKSIFHENKAIELSILDGVACWKLGEEKLLTAHQWKQIGYVSGIAWAFNISELKLSDLK